MKITVNGTEYITDGSRLSYEDVITMAGYAPNRVISVTFHKRELDNRVHEGILTRGQSVTPSDGMKFSAHDTSNA